MKIKKATFSNNDFVHSFLLFQDKSTINLDNRDLPEGWYNSHIVAPIFDDCLESMDECILRRYLSRICVVFILMLY